MRVLVACEFSGVVRDAFIQEGYDAISCDLLDSERPGPHHKGDVRDILGDGWDLMIAHPPCTHLAVSGASSFRNKQKEQIEALEFVIDLLQAPIPCIALENPVSIISTFVTPPTQRIQPYWFCHNERKTICLWLKNLPKLVPTNVVGYLKKSYIHSVPAYKDRWKIRSRFYPGIAWAMAQQWGSVAQARKQLTSC